MTVFQYIKSILDEEYSELSRLHDDPDTVVKSRLRRLESAYRNLGNRAPDIEYSDMATRFAYVFRYATCHSHIVACAIESCPELETLLSSGTPTVACIGGGPGSDFLGLIHYLSSSDFDGSILCYLLDHEESWGDNWSDVGTRWPGLQFRPSTYFQRFDALDRASWTIQRRYLKADLFSFVYFASELYYLRDRAEPFFEHLFSSAKEGALFLYIDNDSDVFSDWFDEMATRFGLAQVRTHSCDKRLPRAEQADDLKEYRSKFGSPRLKAKVLCRVYRKTGRE